MDPWDALLHKPILGYVLALWCLLILVATKHMIAKAWKSPAQVKSWVQVILVNEKLRAIINNTHNKFFMHLVALAFMDPYSYFSCSCFGTAPLSMCVGNNSNSATWVIDPMHKPLDLPFRSYDKSPWGREYAAILGTALGYDHITLKWCLDLRHFHIFFK